MDVEELVIHLLQIHLKVILEEMIVDAGHIMGLVVEVELQLLVLMDQVLQVEMEVQVEVEVKVDVDCGDVRSDSEKDPGVAAVVVEDRGRP